jgi:hypothetical protein
MVYPKKTVVTRILEAQKLDSSIGQTFPDPVLGY